VRHRRCYFAFIPAPQPQTKGAAPLEDAVTEGEDYTTLSHRYRRSWEWFVLDLISYLVSVLLHLIPPDLAHMPSHTLDLSNAQHNALYRWRECGVCACIVGT
jgi:hypothetical protein